MLTRRYHLLLLAAVVLTAYYPAVFAGFSKIDDYGLVKWLEQIKGCNFHSFFFPSFVGGYYYRPLFGISFLVDKYVLALTPGLMHLANILLHLTNAVLIYFITLHIIPPSNREKSMVPLAAALAFGLHPINSESVNWISGRTDILAGLFIFSSVLFLLKFKECHKRRFAILSLSAFLCGTLSKETAVALLPGAFLLIHARTKEDKNNEGEETRKTGQRRLLTRNIMITVGAVAVVAIFIFFRSSAYISNTSRIGITIRDISGDWINALLVVLRAFGFYMKKLIIPYPLNFAIMEIDPLYEVLAAPLVAFCVYLATRRTLASALFVAGACLLTPAFVLAFGQIAWTPYAERYLYMTGGFSIVAAVVYLQDKVKIPNIFVMKALVAMVLATMFASTLSRSIVWQNDLTLVKDTVEKSPLSREMRVVYGGMLAEKGEYDGALVQLRQARAIPRFDYDERLDLNSAYIAYQRGINEEALKLLDSVLQKTHWQSMNALNGTIGILEEEKQAIKEVDKQRALEEKIFAYNLKLYELNHDPHLLYKLGGDAAVLGQFEQAIDFYRKAHDQMTGEDPFKGFAQKQIARLVETKHLTHAQESY